MAETTIKLDPITIAQLILQYGIPGVIKIIEVLTKPTITLEDIQGLRGLVRLPDAYLEVEK